MKLRLALLAVALLGVFTTSFAQLTDEQKKKSDQVLHDIRKLELYNYILPVLLTKEQTNDLMTILEVHRADSKRYELNEHKFLIEAGKEISDALKEAMEKGKISDPEVMDKAAKLFTAFTVLRKSLVDDTAKKLGDKMRSKLNEGQIRSAANAFDPRIFDPSLDPEKMTEAEKLEMWILIVLMDPIAYDIMLELSRK